MNSNNQQLIELMTDMQTQDALYKPTTFWKEASKVIIEDFTKKDMQDFRNFSSSLGMFVPTYAFPEYIHNNKKYVSIQENLKETTEDVKSNLKLEMLIRGEVQAFADYRVLCASDKNFSPYLNKVSESTVGNPPEQFIFDGRNFSRSFLNYLLGLSFLKQHVDTSKIKTILEIGGGFGTLGEILLQEERNQCFYINVDIPPVLSASTYYLQELFGNSNIADYTRLKKFKTIDIEQLQTQYKAACISSWQLPKLEGKIDLFVNFISFQEMEPEVVQNYCEHITRLNPEYILLRNIEEGKRKQDKDYIYGVKEPIVGDRYDTFLPQYRLIATDESIFGLKMEDNFHSQLRLYVKKAA